VHRLSLLLAIFGVCLPLFGGPTSTYYLPAGDSNTNWIIQGDTAQSFSQHIGGENAIAVSGGQVRTLGLSLGGSLYDLSFAYLGTDYTSGDLNFLDGTSDGTYNYSVGFLTGRVYRTNLDWSNPTELFDTGLGRGNSLGITYDPVNDSLWVSAWNSTNVYDFTLAGGLVSSFDAGHVSITSLAMDRADHTLWLGNAHNFGTFQQFSTTGTLLQTQFYENMAQQNTLGGEFVDGDVPEPASGLLLGCALAGLVMLRRRRR
jgi:hypothetical protein